MRRAFRRAVFLILLLTGWGDCAWLRLRGEARRADHSATPTTRKLHELSNPANDAALIAETFKLSGFPVVSNFVAT